MAVYDPARRRSSVRKGRETGAWIYIPGEELEAIGFAKGEPSPFYRIWTRRKTILVQFYREP